MRDLPSADQLTKLPRRAVAALLARCARRVQPLLTPMLSGAPPESISATDAPTALAQRIEMVEKFAKGETFEEPAPTGRITGEPAVSVFQTVYLALRAIRSASTRDDSACQLAAASLGWAKNAAFHWASGSDTILITAVALDLDHLLAVAAHEKWTDDTPVSPETLGPLWPEGEPERWSTGGDAAVSARVAVRPFYASQQPNESIMLYEGPLIFRTSISECQGGGTVRFVWLPRPEVVFDVPEATPLEVVPHLGAGMLTSPTRHFGCAASVSNLRLQGGPEGSTLGFQGHVVEWPTVTNGDGLTAVVFHLANFHSFLRPRPQPEQPDYDIHRTVFEAEGWRVTLEAVENINGLTDSLDGCAGCAFTHAGRVERANGSPFDATTACELLDAFFYFFSFARGQWSPALLPVGLDSQGNRVWERWDARTTSDWRFRHSWFPEHMPDCLADVFPGFMRLWKDPDWNQTLRVAIHWYIESNAQAGAIEGALVLHQLAIELLASRLFVEERRKYTEAQFRKTNLFPAETKMKLLLTEAKIPTAIPVNLANLAGVGQTENWADGPITRTRLRNCITHPTGRNRQTLDRVSSSARFEAINLALWYLELILLWLMGYNGGYVNRLTVKFNGEQEKVPWAHEAPTT
jgi:hypothetical protein